ncbi:MAG: ribosome biogenesis GTPase Der [Proteobacteria bacterium]|nr:ribosome biogenesis GTPase Der [Pseudomonadota bacterium]
MPLTIAIVGRPNVGKSTLFNRLAGKKLAIVHDTPGVTRDRHEALTVFNGHAVRLIDTAGFEEGEAGSLSQRMTGQTRTAIGDADVCVFVVDVRAGVTAGDEIIAAALRRAGKPVVLVTNKSEARERPNEAEAYALGFGEPIAVSAEHALGIGELIDAILAYVTEEPGASEEGGEEKGPLKLAIVGRPNVGKSSLFNRLLGEERSLTSPEAGTTRDAVVAKWKAGGREILLHDTAGLRKKARVAGHLLEEMSVDSALEAIRFAECVVVMIDAAAPFEKQDLTIADLIAREGRAVVFAVNKWDLVEHRGGKISELREKLDRLLPQLWGAPLIAVSARTGEGVDRLLPAIEEADRAWNFRVSTSQLNKFLEDALARHPPPAISGRRVRVRYMTQVKARPPTFALFGNQLDGLPEHYLRYLTNELREAFDLKGVPMRFALRTSKNPFADSQ